MTTLVLTDEQVPAVQRALTSTVEILETEARDREKRLGTDQHVEEERQEAALLTSALKQLAADQSPGLSRAPAREVSTRYTGARR